MRSAFKKRPTGTRQSLLRKPEALPWTTVLTAVVGFASLLGNGIQYVANNDLNQRLTSTTIAKLEMDKRVAELQQDLVRGSIKSQGIDYQLKQIDLYAKQAAEQAASAAERATVKKLDAEIAFRIRGVPDVIRRSRMSDNPTVKGNLLSGVFAIAEGDWPTPLFPEYAKRSLIALVYELAYHLSGAERKSVDRAYLTLTTMGKASREKYYVHDMFRMSVDQLTLAEREAEDYFSSLIQRRPAWKSP